MELRNKTIAMIQKICEHKPSPTDTPVAKSLGRRAGVWTLKDLKRDRQADCEHRRAQYGEGIGPTQARPDLLGRADWNMLECIRFPWHRARELAGMAIATAVKSAFNRPKTTAKTTATMTARFLSD